MKTLRTRIDEARKRLSKLPMQTPGWSKVAAAIHAAGVHLQRAEEAIDEAEEVLNADQT